MSKTRFFSLVVATIIAGCGTDQKVVEKVVPESCSANNPCPKGATCMNDGLCYKIVETPSYMGLPQECVMHIKYAVTNFSGQQVEEGEITRDLDCCNSDADCSNSTYGRHCVAQTMHINDQFADPAKGYTGFCQWCNQDKQIGCPSDQVCHWGAQDLLAFTGVERLLTENSGRITINGPASRSVYFCNTPDLCGDGKQNATETDVDCGTHGYYSVVDYKHGCDLCKLGKKCVDDFDCKSKWCDHGTCASCRNDRDCRVDYSCKSGTCTK